MARMSGTELADKAMDARIERVLSVRVRSSYGFITRREFVERMVADGARVESSKAGERRLARPDGVFVNEAGITKIAIDYAESIA